MGDMAHEGVREPEKKFSLTMWLLSTELGSLGLVDDLKSHLKRPWFIKRKHPETRFSLHSIGNHRI